MAKGKYQEWITPEGLLLLEGWARDGLTDVQIAKNMGITATSLYNYKNKYVEIFEALKKGKEVVDREVENALIKRALGYRYEEVTKELKDGELQVTKIVTKEVSPDTGAAAFWLKNRKPDKYRDKPETEDNKQMTISFDEGTIAALAAEAEKLNGADNETDN